MAQIPASVRFTLASLCLVCTNVYATVVDDAIAIFDASGFSADWLSSLFSNTTIAMTSVFVVWLLVAAYRAHIEGEMKFMALFMMFIRLTLITVVVSIFVDTL